MVRREPAKRDLPERPGLERIAWHCQGRVSYRSSVVFDSAMTEPTDMTMFVNADGAFGWDCGGLAWLNMRDSAEAAAWA